MIPNDSEQQIADAKMALAGADALVMPRSRFVTSYGKDYKFPFEFRREIGDMGEQNFVIYDAQGFWVAQVATEVLAHFLTAALNDEAQEN